ncbi:MAG TPA: hypothetical protein VLZ05_09620 [Mycobacterium sp.]|nr:hypothetical protein [Mycobacterium sp.]HUH69104.1 hypothetical protein [Mycobacterium sp.]
MTRTGDTDERRQNVTGSLRTSSPSEAQVGSARVSSHASSAASKPTGANVPLHDWPAQHYLDIYEHIRRHK